MMKSRGFWPAGLLVILFLSGCAATEAAREVQMGRRALRQGNPRAAVSHFDAAARIDPDYKTNYEPIPVGVWTYIGRAYYEAGEMERALENLRRAKERHRDDPFAPLYLGTVMAREGQEREAPKEVESGLKGLELWLENIRRHSQYGKYWDPGRYLTGNVEGTLSMLRAERIDWKKVEENVNWLGKRFDDELEEARRLREIQITGEGREGGNSGPR